MQTASPGAGRRPLVIVNPSAARGRTGRELSHYLAGIRDAIGAADIAETRPRRCAASCRGGRPGAPAARRRPRRRRHAQRDRQRAPGWPAAGPQRGPTGCGISRRPGSPPALGIVGTGTGGDYGRSLGIQHDLGAYLAALRGGAARTVDVGRARFAGLDGATAERYWLNVLSAGIGGLVDRYTAAAPAFLGGRVAYAQATVRAIVTCRRTKLLCRYVDPDGTPRERLLDAHAVAICNGRTFGGGMNIAPMARLDDGLLEVVAFETATRWRLIGRFRTVYSGTHTQEPGVSHFTCRSVELELARRMGRTPRAGAFPLDVDGDALGDVPLRIDVAPGALRVRAPVG